MKILEWIEDKIIPNQILPKEGPTTIYGVVTLDPGNWSRPSYKEVFELHVKRGSKFPLHYGLPATVKLFKSKFMKLNRLWDNYLFAIFKMNAPDGWTLAQVKNAYAGFLAGNRCYTNGHGPEDHRSDVLGVNYDKPYMAKETILTSGAIVMILDSAKRYLKAGEWYYKIAIMDGNKKPPALPPNGGMSPFVHWATNSRRELYREPDETLTGREDIVTKFPQLAGNDCPMINMGDGTWDLIPCNRVSILQTGEIWPDPYNF